MNALADVTMHLGAVSGGFQIPLPLEPVSTFTSRTTGRQIQTWGFKGVSGMWSDSHSMGLKRIY
jgi:hypothetical protein